jgi:uncharacterized iron-regulated membrane protein
MMTLRNWHKVHKWIWVFTGIFLIGWLLSGIMMLIPQNLIGANPETSAVRADYDSITLSPHDAIEKARQMAGTRVLVERVILRTVYDRILYAVKLEARPEFVIDAATGESFSMSPELAKTIVKHGFPGAGNSLSVRTLTAHSLEYPWGALPAFIVTSEPDSSVRYLLNPVSGKVFRSTTLSRARSAILSLHDFSALKVIVSSENLRKLLLLFAAVLALSGAFLGYYLALPHGRNK